MEMGQPMEHPEQALAMREAHDYDFVILSLHNIPNIPDFYLLRTDRMSEQHYHMLYDKLLDAMIASVAFPGVHTLAHVTYPARYWAEAGKQFDIKPHIPRLTKLFEALCKQGVALEVNVSTLWKGYGFAMPDREVLELYKHVGGELVTIGSDAHAPGNVGNSIADGCRLLLDCGFDKIVAYKEGKQFFVPITL
jgi:histidinol-phosphatase (PHP family)